jgi:putative ABC transport system permease protein
MIARRPRRAVLAAASISVTVTGLVAVLAFHATADARLNPATSGLGDPVVDRDEQMLVVLTIALIALAALNAIVTAWATVLETRRSSALTRALGASPRQLTLGLVAAQLLPTLPGALLGVPFGIALFALANGGGTQATVIPPAWWLVAAVLGTTLALASLTALPARIGARQPIAPVLTEA